MKLIKIKGHFYVLSDKKHDSHKVSNWVYETHNCIPVYQFSYDIDEYPLFRVLASTIKLGTLPLIDFNQLQELMLDVLAKEHYPEDSNIHIDMRKTWIERYSHNHTDKKWTDSDMRSAFEIGKTTHFEITKGLNTIDGGEEVFHKMINSKEKTEFDIELEMEEYFLFQDCDDDDAPHHFKPKINNNGFINILNIK